MFGFSLASQLFQGSRERTWNCIARFTNLFWNKFNHFKHPDMPRSRKRHHSHSRSRSKSRSHSRDRSYERHKKIDGHDKDGKRRKLESCDSPQHKRSVSCDRLPDKIEEIHQKEEDIVKNELLGEKHQVSENESQNDEVKESIREEKETAITEQADTNVDTNVTGKVVTSEVSSGAKNNADSDVSCSNSEQGDGQVGSSKMEVSETGHSKMEVSDDETDQNVSATVDDSDYAPGRNTPRNETTPKKHLTPKQLQRRLDSEKKRQEKQKERDEIKKKKQEEKDRLQKEKLKQKREKEAERLKQLEEKQKEKEMKEEQKRKEKEEKEQKRKEKEEKEEQKRKEKEQEKLKRQQELEEKNKEKQREEEKKQKAAAAFVNFFVPKKSESNPEEKEKKLDDTCSIFMPFEVKSDMKLAPVRRDPLTELEKKNLENLIENPDNTASYLKELRGGKTVGKGFKTWPYEDPDDDDVVMVEESDLGETICENTKMKVRAKFLRFHENKRPPYFGTWRKKSKIVKPRRPFAEDKDKFNYEEDSDDDWEEEEQGESLNGSDDEADKENEEEKDDYEVDNEFFVPHGHLSDDEIDDEEKARLSPESLKQKLKLLKDEFEEDMKLKTHKLKPRFIGCVWYNKKGNNVDESIHKYLQPFAMIFQNPVEIKKRSEIFNNSTSARKPKLIHELPVDQWPLFLKVVHGNVNNQKILVEQFITQMGNNGITVDVSKSRLIKILKQAASWKKYTENGPYKNKFAWFVSEEIQQKYKVNLELPSSC